MTHAHQTGIEVDIFPPGQHGMKPGAQLQQGSDPATHCHGAGGGQGHARNQLEQGAFSRAVAADNAHRLARLHTQGNIFQRGKCGDTTQTQGGA